MYWRMAGYEVNFVRVMSAVNPGHQINALKYSRCTRIVFDFAHP